MILNFCQKKKHDIKFDKKNDIKCDATHDFYHYSLLLIFNLDWQEKKGVSYHIFYININNFFPQESSLGFLE
jgi:hypothetical protein